jgi:hypothetical protein
MQALIEGAVLSDAATMLPALLRTGRACAQLRVEPPDGGVAYGTGFLVGDDLVLTAWHVVYPLVGPDGAEAQPGTRISVRFPNRLDEPSALWPNAPIPAAERGWLVFWSRPAGTPPILADAVLADALGDRLDCALVRLSTAVPEAVPRLDVADPPAPLDDSYVHLMGHLSGGGALSFDRGRTRKGGCADTRVRHGAGAVKGMSGGPCLDSSGRVLALHEGAADLPDPRHNRGVALRPVRVAMRAAGTDPLDAVAASWRIRSPEAVKDWAARAGVAWDGRDATHPVFGRRELREWAAQGRAGTGPGILLVSGGPGGGKSFTAHLLRAWLAGGADALAVLPPEVVRNGGDGAVVARCDAALGLPPAPRPTDGLRAPAGARLRDLLEPALARWEARTRTGSVRRLWVVADLGVPEAWSRAPVREFWADLLRLVPPRKAWLRVAVLGIGRDHATALWNNVGAAKADVLLERLESLDWNEDVWPVVRQALSAARKPNGEDAEPAQLQAWLAMVGDEEANRCAESVRFVRGL